VVGTHGCGGRAGGRFLFLVPWRHVSILGTSHDAHEGGADALKVTRWDVEAFLADARQAFPHAQLTSADVRLVHRGLLPMVSGHESHVQLLRESAVVDHAAHGIPGLVSMFGVRYTTARATAEEAIDAVFRTRGVAAPPPCRTASTPVVGGSIEDKETFLRAAQAQTCDGIAPETLRRLALTYGTRYDAVLQIIRQEPALGQPLGRHCAVTGAEVVYAVTYESTIKLSDTLLRRTEAGSAGHPGVDAVVRTAEIMARLLEWSADQKRQEISELEAFYRWME
jgi:glycerol-3-phosphate dehydrogenase